MRSIEDIQADIRALSSEMLELAMHYEKLKDSCDIENDEEDEKYEVYDEIVSTADTVTEILVDAGDEMRYCVSAMEELKTLKKSV